MQKYTMLYGVPCKIIEVLTPPDKYGLVRVSYKIKHGKKLHKLWIDQLQLHGIDLLKKIIP